MCRATAAAYLPLRVLARDVVTMCVPPEMTIYNKRQMVGSVDISSYDPGRSVSLVLDAIEEY